MTKFGTNGRRESRFFELSSDRRPAALVEGTQIQTRNNWTPLAVYDEDGKQIGHWTLIFDEGFDIVLGSGQSYTGFFRFIAKDEDCDIQHAVEAHDASTGCVKTVTSGTMIGWYNEKNGIQGCFSGKKTDKTKPQKPQHRDCSAEPQPHIAGIAGVPKSWSVGDPMDRPDLMSDWEYDIPSQGKCGACYGIASAFALAKRSSYNSTKGSRAPPDLAPVVRDITNCSLYNQGCQGGYPYLAHKWMQIFGSLWDSRRRRLGSNRQSSFLMGVDGECRDARISKILQGELPMSYELDSSQRSFHVANHGYVGGCYGCASEAAIREELYIYGPLVAAIDVPQDLLTYTEGILGKNRQAPHHRLCDLDNVSGWEYTNHAIVLVGYGVEEDESGKTPYWIARNSWGRSWGQNGYFKVIRGIDFGGIENQVTYADPDFRGS